MNASTVDYIHQEQVLVTHLLDLRYVFGTHEPQRTSVHTEFSILASVYILLLLEHLASLPEVSSIDLYIYYLFQFCVFWGLALCKTLSIFPFLPISYSLATFFCRRSN